MSFPEYHAYRESHVDWIGTVPSDWHVAPLKAIARVINGYPFDAALFDPSDGYPLIRIRDLNQTAPDARYKGEFVAAASIDNDDVLVGMDGEFNVGRWFGEVPALLNQRMCCVRASTRTVTRYLEYVLPTPLKAINDVTYSTTVKHLSSFDVLKIRVAMPPTISEVQAVVDFLDRETSKIDALVEEQRRLIELLKEKRQAVISRAVTKGLNASVPMKSSGVEWLGDVPAHWDVKRNKVVFREIDDRNDDSEGELMTVSHLTGVTPRSEKNVNMILAETLEGYKRARAGDLVINTMWAWMGALGISPCDGLFSPSYNVYRIHDPSRLHPLYYDYLCRVPQHVTAMKSKSTGIWESRLRLYPDVFLDMRLCIPPLAEQIAIASALGRQLKALDDLTVEAEQGIQLFQERRAALISAAVTGKIDVRGLAPQPEGAAA